MNKFLSAVSDAFNENIGVLVEMVVAMAVSTILFIAMVLFTSIGFAVTNATLHYFGVTGGAYTLLGWIKLGMLAIEGVIFLGVLCIHAYHYLKKMANHH